MEGWRDEGMERGCDDGVWLRLLRGGFLFVEKGGSFTRKLPGTYLPGETEEPGYHRRAPGPLELPLAPRAAFLTAYLHKLS